MKPYRDRELGYFQHGAHDYDGYDSRGEYGGETHYGIESGYGAESDGHHEHQNSEEHGLFTAGVGRPRRDLQAEFGGDPGADPEIWHFEPRRDDGALAPFGIELATYLWHGTPAATEPGAALGHDSVPLLGGAHAHVESVQLGSRFSKWISVF